MNRRTAGLALSAFSALSLAASLANAGYDASASDLGLAGGSLVSSPATRRTMVIGNHLQLEVLGGNLLTTSRESLRALTASPLSTNAFAQGTLHEALLDPNAREVMQALVECALASDQSVSWAPTPEERTALTQATSDRGGLKGRSFWAPLAGTFKSSKDPLVWHGHVGLCPDWHTAAPSAACQELVSACLFARNNAFGVTVDISMEWDALTPEDSWDAVASTPEALEEAAVFRMREGAFFGNLLDPEQLNEAAEVYLKKGVSAYVIGRPSLDEVDLVYKSAFVCHPADHSAVFPLPYASERACVDAYGDVAPGCLARHVGACRGFATGKEGRMGPPNVCEQEPVDPVTGRRVYDDCLVDGRVWQNPITVFLEKECIINPAVCEYAENWVPEIGDLPFSGVPIEDRCVLFPESCSIVDKPFSELPPFSQPITADVSYAPGSF
ncbi:hypothetical protein WMF45_23095 [Sorangium sp. So ce448]|uniref:hypothetical protein n=1 Tax=Sorangium sp. So ce448 TaxID=3133314 RepID=UPI003F6384ED